MTPRDRPLTTPIYHKTCRDMPGPKDSFAYILTGSGLFKFRRDSWLGESCVPARNWPTELERQAPYLIPAFPLIPQRQFELLVGFFDINFMRYGGEAIAQLFWDMTRSRYRIVVPPQVATVGLSRSGAPYPIGVEYRPLLGMPAHWKHVGDAHCHGDGPACTSAVDLADETHSPGLHIVVGRIGQDPPHLSVAAVIDGHRFELNWRDAIAGYEKRRWRVPRSWLNQVRARVDFVAGGPPEKESRDKPDVEAPSGGPADGQDPGDDQPLTT